MSDMNHGTNELFLNFKEQLAAIRNDLKGIYSQLQAVIKLEADVGSQAKDIGRMEKVQIDHERRISELETASTVNSKSSNRFDRLMERVVFLVVGALVMLLFKGGLS